MAVSPIGSVVVVQVATLVLRTFAAHPVIVDDPALNSTVPLGFATADDVTVAVNSTDCVTTDGFASDTTAVALDAWATVCGIVLDSLAVNDDVPP